MHRVRGVHRTGMLGAAPGGSWTADRPCGTQELRTRNCSALSLTVTEANFGAVQLYRKLGFDLKRKFDAFVWEG